MPLSLVEVDEAGTTTNVLSLAVTKTTTATADNFLIAGVAVRVGWDDHVTPSGWTLFASGVSTLSYALYYKISDGTETGITFSSTADTGKPEGFLAEYSGNITSGFLNASAENTTNIGTAVTSQPSGNATSTTTDGSALAVFLCEDGRDWGTTETVDSGFTIDHQTSGSSGHGHVGLCRLDITATGSYGATYSTTDAGSPAYGACLIIDSDAGGGSGATIPIFRHHYVQQRSS